MEHISHPFDLFLASWLEQLAGRKVIRRNGLDAGRPVFLLEDGRRVVADYCRTSGIVTGFQTV